MKKNEVYIATPSMSGEVWVGYLKSALHTFMVLTNAGYQVNHDVMSGCSNICVARNVMFQDFIDSDAKALLFIDADLSWPAEAALELVKSPHDVIGGVYPAKQDDPAFLAKFKVGATRLLEAEGMPGGFLKISRRAAEKLVKSYPDMTATYKEGRTIHTFFDNGIVNGVYVGEDYAFCHRWTSLGEKAFILPDITFEHYGRKAWSGNLAEYRGMNKVRAA